MPIISHSWSQLTTLHKSLDLLWEEFSQPSHCPIPCTIFTFDVNYSVATVIFYAIASIITVVFLDESNPSVLERQRVLENLRSQNLDPQMYEERKKQLLRQLEVQCRKWSYSTRMIIVTTILSYE